MRHKVVSREEWLEVRKAPPRRRRGIHRQQDAMTRKIRELPWVKVEKKYGFEGPKGRESLEGLFRGRSQLIIYHFMVGPDWEEGCKSCSFHVVAPPPRPVRELIELWNTSLVAFRLLSVLHRSADGILSSGRRSGNEDELTSGVDPGGIRLERDGDGFRTEDLWHTDDVSLHMTNWVVVDGVFYGLSHLDSGKYFGLDLESGGVLWTSEPRQAENAAIVRAGSTIFSLEDDAELVMLSASRSGFEVRKRYPVRTASPGPSAISGNRIYVKDISSLTLWTID